jgi:hypothetical protein
MCAMSAAADMLLLAPLHAGEATYRPPVCVRDSPRV